MKDTLCAMIVTYEDAMKTVQNEVTDLFIIQTFSY